MLTVQEVAEKLRFSDQQIKNWIAQGKLKAYKFGGHYRIDENDFNDFMKESTINETEIKGE